MSKLVQRFIILLSLIVAGSILTFGQNGSTAPLSGTVVDANDAVVVGANVKVTEPSTGREFTATTSDKGTFTIPALSTGVYTIRVTASGFKQALVKDVKMDVGVPATVKITLEVGGAAEEVIVQATGEILQTQSANVSTTITGRQITELPFASRDALDLVLFMPGTQTVGRPRQSTINGLPKGSLNITIDGINVQANDSKSSDGYFTYIRPRTDAIDEVTVSTATPGAESSGEGAAQIKFVTRSGSNNFTGSVYEYHRNPVLNSNYYFSKFGQFDKNTGAFSPLPNQRLLLNQFGGRLGGPILKDKFFFFVNYEEFRLPQQALRTRQILTPNALNGIYTNGTVSINVLQQAAAKGFISSLDPTVSKLLSDIKTAAGTTGTLTPNSGSPQNLLDFKYNVTSMDLRKFPTIRFDYNLTSKHHIENTYNYGFFGGGDDLLNGREPRFPGFPNHSSQPSSRFSDSFAVRSTVTPNLVNEARFGFQGGVTRFNSDSNASQFGNQGGLSLALNLGATSATTTNSSSRSSSPTWQFIDNVSWTRGAHNLSFGFDFTQINRYIISNGRFVPTISFGVTDDSSDSMGGNNNPFTQQDGTKLSSTDLANARALYSMLVGRVTGITESLFLDEASGKYAIDGPLTERAHQREIGIYAQDSWRFRPNLTLTGGLRYEVQFPYRSFNQTFAQVSFADLFGVSGAGNIFKPGTLTGNVSQVLPFGQNDDAYKTDWNNFAPSIGVAWTPEVKDGLLKRLFGENGRTVLRGGFSMAFNREGTDVVSSILDGNPGGSRDATRQIGGVGPANLSAGTMLRNIILSGGGVADPVGFSASPTYPITPAFTEAVNAFLPNLKLGYIPSWTVSIQRELDKNTVVELRYVGNRGIKLWRQYNLNEVNVVENGFLNEFKTAQANLYANIAAGKGKTIAYTGIAGTAPLPIMYAYFQGPCTGACTGGASNPTNYTSSQFTNTTNVNSFRVENPSAFTVANLLATSTLGSTFRANAIAAGLPANFFVVNPTVANGGSFIVDNGNRSYYDGFIVELRRRLSKGLLIQTSYTYSKSLASGYASSGVVFNQYSSLHDPSLSRTLSPFDLTHGFKANWIYELPFGKGQRFLDSSNSILSHLLGGWQIDGTARIQSGSSFNLGNVQLVGITPKELQKLIGVYSATQVTLGKAKDSAGVVTPTVTNNTVAGSGFTIPSLYWLPPDIVRDTIRAFNTGFAIPGNPLSNLTTDPSFGNPIGSIYIAPANTGNNPLKYGGSNGYSNLILHGPHFTRFDISFVKKTKITERINFEFRAELLNAFNNINFKIGSLSSDTSTGGTLSSTAFGQITNAYQDPSTTNDPGGRLVQFVARINF